MLRKIFVTSTLALATFAVVSAQFTPAEAKLKCKDVKGRWQICGDAKPFKKFVLGVGIRFNKQKPGLKANTQSKPKPAKKIKKLKAQ